MNSKKSSLNSSGKSKKDQSMTKTYKFIAGVSAFVLLCGIVAAAWVIIAGVVALGPAPGFYEDGKEITKDSGTMLTVGDVELSVNEYRYFYLQSKYAMDYGSEDFWEEDKDGENAKLLKENTEKVIKEYYAWLSMAKDNELGLTKKEKAEVLKNLELDKKEYGTEFKMYLKKQFFADEEAYIYFRGNDIIVKKMQAKYEEIVAERVEKDMADTEGFLEKVVTVKHILVPFTAEGSEDEEATQKENQLKLAQDIVKQLNGAEGEGRNTLFEELRLEHNTDGGSAEPNSSYTFGPGTMIEVFYDAALELEVGQVSEPVESDFGYHIIYRIELDQEAAPDAEKTAEFEVYKTAYTSALSASHLEEYTEALVLKGGKYYDKVSVETIK